MVCSYSNARLPDGGAWFCLRTHFKRKHIAAGYTESMFSSILFARLDYRAFHREIRQRPAVSGFVQFGERLALLPDALISEFRTRTGLDEIVEVGRAFEPGQEVEITQGPFRGLKTLVTSTHHGSRSASNFSSNGWAAPCVPKRASQIWSPRGEVQDAVKKFNDRYSP